MAKDPAFPFYAQDYLVDTIRWSRSMQGLHVSLLAESWANGGLVDDSGFPGGLGSTDVEIWLKIKHKWTLVDGLWINEKLEEVRNKRNVFREKQREKGIISAESRKKQSTKSQPKVNNGSTTVEPIEKENENEKEIELKERVKGEETDFSDFERWTADIISGNDWQFHDKIKNLSINVNGHLREFATSHLALLAKYPKMKPPDQNRFRISLIGHIQDEQKKQSNGNRTTSKGTSSTISAQIGGTDYDNQQL